MKGPSRSRRQDIDDFITSELDGIESKEDGPPMPNMTVKPLGGALSKPAFMSLKKP